MSIEGNPAADGPAGRDDVGRWKPGVSGNPVGRPPAMVPSVRELVDGFGPPADEASRLLLEVMRDVRASFTVRVTAAIAVLKYPIQDAARLVGRAVPAAGEALTEDELGALSDGQLLALFAREVLADRRRLLADSGHAASPEAALSLE